MIEITRKEADYIYSNVVIHLEGGSKKKKCIVVLSIISMLKEKMFIHS